MKQLIFIICLLLIAVFVYAFPPVVSNVVMIQSDHPCGTYEFGATIFYNLADEFGHTSYISVVISEDSGQTWTITPTLAFLSGDIRSGVHRGVNKAIYWDISNEYQRFYGHNYRAKVTVVDETPEAPIPSNFVFVDGGTFNNGTSDVTLSSFYLDKYELTQSAYSDVMLNNPSDFSNVINGPVEKINWFEAIEYCNRRSMKEGFTPCYSYSTDAHGNYGTNPNNWPEGWNTDFHNHTNVSCSWTANGYRLPTEMEWMFAAQGGNQPHNYTYSGSDDINSVAWYIENGYSGYTTHAVGGKLPNELGLYDMSGNVWELCWDNFVDGYYPPGPQTNPTGVLPSSSTYYPPYHVLRGGSCDTYAISCATSYRWRQRATDHFWNTCVGFRVCRTANEFVLVDGGTFNNGTSNVTVSPFYLAKSELTQSAFNNVMEYNPSGFTNVCNGPVESVSWCEAIKYCNQRSRLEGLTPCYSLYGSTDPETWQEWQQYPGEMPVYMPYDGYIECDWSANGYRLPTEAEWEFAARGGNHSYSTDYSGSNTINNVAWYTSNSGSKTHTVGTNGSNELGIYDMSGNVYEWCWDAEGDYPGGDITDPHGPIIWSDSSFRALRGGGWNSYDEYCKVGFRNFYNASTLVKETSYGFRLCRNAP